MQPSRYNLFFITLLLIFSGACVSIDLPTKSNSHTAENVIFQNPPAPYEKIESKNVDSAWKNKHNGTIISFVSECSEQNDPSLKSLKEDTLYGLSQREVLEESITPFLDREALRTRVKGKVDGVLTYLNLLVFKKNGCSYIISQVQVPPLQSNDQTIFTQFLKEFRTP
ncbi:MAG: hypothetical protein K1X29_07650 [Bdellovibrionales bacterium]|nr:hypothetical protein [Bdellovibrionales bacterium]